MVQVTQLPVEARVQVTQLQAEAQVLRTQVEVLQDQEAPVQAQAQEVWAKAQGEEDN